jgi:amino-acid N-acetyltransferase
MDQHTEVHVSIRDAQAEDVPAMAQLINAYAAQGLMLPRSEEQILRHLSDFVVAEHSGRIVGCGALARLSPDLAEVRSLAVAPEMRGRGIGRALVRHLLEKARAAEIAQVCALTLQPGFFEPLGFRVIDRWDISPKIWQECIYCPKFHRCDEIAVLLTFEEVQARSEEPEHEERPLNDFMPLPWRRDFARTMGNVVELEEAKQEM